MPFVEKRVDEDQAAAIEMVRLSRQQGVPTIVVDGQVVVGFDRPRLERLLQDAQQGRVSLGASVADAARILSQRGQIPVFGAYVGKVSPGSMAERLGLQPGDIITQVNVRPVSRADDVAKALEGLGRGAPVAVVWARGGRSLRGEATL